MERRAAARAGINIGVNVDDVGLGYCWILCHGDEQQEHGRERRERRLHFSAPDGAIPASARTISNILFSASSLPVISNHSCNVCAPPPIPPAPMAIASRPSESGMFASVEAR